MRYDRDNENFRRGQYGNNRRSNERYHQFGAEEDRSMQDSSRDYGRYRNEEISREDNDFYREQDRGYESESRSDLGGDFNFGGRSSSYGRNRRYGENTYQRDPYPTQNRSVSNFDGDYSVERRDSSANRFGFSSRPDRDFSNDRVGYRGYSGDRYFGDFSDSSYGSYESRGRYEPEHRSMWESVKDFFGVGPKGYSRSDDRIREDVSDALTRDRAVDASEIEVTVKEGVVNLRGSVSDKWMKRRAEDCAEEISGVREVRNDLEVKRESSTSSMNYLNSNNRTGSIGTGGALSAGTSTGTNTGSSKNADRSGSSGKRKLS